MKRVLNEWLLRDERKLCAARWGGGKWEIKGLRGTTVGHGGCWGLDMPVRSAGGIFDGTAHDC
jgi:hypothetical protein